MTYKDATDRAFALGITAAELAGELGVKPNTIRVARLGSDASGFRNPPFGWQAALARLLRERAAALVELAVKVEA